MPHTSLKLTIATPVRVVVDGLTIQSLRAEDESGAFGIRVGHMDMVALLRKRVRCSLDDAGRSRAFLWMVAF
jgi:F-type H+-transporting ATPase subunit epsilon